jgi:ABC-type Fe3+-hydroxamate transport system substrate-binding protein
MTMASFELANDTIATFPIIATDAAGAVVPLPAGVTPTAVSSNPASLNVVVNTVSPGVFTVSMNAMVQLSPGLTVTIGDGTLTTDVQGVDIVADVTPVAAALNLSAVTFAPQAVPTAPGP